MPQHELAQRQAPPAAPERQRALSDARRAGAGNGGLGEAVLESEVFAPFGRRVGVLLVAEREPALGQRIAQLRSGICEALALCRREDEQRVAVAGTQLPACGRARADVAERVC